MISSFQLIESVKDEIEKLKQAQSILAKKYAEKVRDTIFKFANIVQVAILYLKMK